MALRDLVVLAVLLSCLLPLHQVMEAMITDYTHLHVQRRRLVIELADATRKRCPRKERRPRRFWIRPGRTCLWWDNFLSGIVVEAEWKENFRMSRVGFFNLASLLRPHVESQAWLYAIYWRAITLLHYRVNTVKTGAKTQHKFPFSPETFPCKRSLCLLKSFECYKQETVERLSHNEHF